MGWAATLFRQFELRKQFHRRGPTNAEDALLSHHQGDKPASLQLPLPTFSQRHRMLEYSAF